MTETGKHKPERMCMSCGAVKDKSELLRIMRDENGYRFDPLMKSGGRGAYVCRDASCVEKMFRKKLLSKSFRKNLPEETYRKLREEFDHLYG